jgi:hypothetical protein
LGDKIDSNIVTMSMSALNEYCLHHVWRTAEKHNAHPDISSGKPVDIDREIYTLARKSLNSDELAAFAINEILPSASVGDLQTVLDIVWKVHDIKMKTRN